MSSVLQRPRKGLHTCQHCPGSKLPRRCDSPTKPHFVFDLREDVVTLKWNAISSSLEIPSVPDELLPIHGGQNPERMADVIFVHGLNGNHGLYWCHDDNPDNYWPAWLAEDLFDFGVWSLGYENAALKSRKASFFRRSGYRGFAMPLWDRAKSVLLQLENNGIGQHPLIFVAHSMGGLLVKQLLAAANEPSAQSPWKNILKNTRGVCFIATPHLGADSANWVSYFRRVLGVNVSVDELRAHDAGLRRLHEFYRSVATEGVGIKTLTFYETKPLVGDLLVVAQGDADPGFSGAGIYALGEDHITICKPRSKSSDIHLKLVDFIKKDCLALSVAAPNSMQTLSPSDADVPWRPKPVTTRRLRKSKWLVSATGIAAALCVSAYILHHTWGWLFPNSPDDMQRHITLRPVDSTLSYNQTVELMGQAAQSGDWQYVAPLRESRIRWTGYITDSKPPDYHVIRPTKESSGKKWEEAIITLGDRNAHRFYAQNECITVTGLVSRLDSKGIDIVDATIEMAR
jgi:pimeloyl-ACP methyl ester carboxylesterase